MIIGKGLIASQFLDCDNENVVFFASGVSNSSETRKEAFLREHNLIKEILAQNQNKLFVYFSTCSIYDSSKYDSPYVLHKLHMEELIKMSTSKYLILRVSNAVGKGGNSNLLINYLFNKIVNEDELNVHKQATRNLIDVEDVKNITLKYVENKSINKIVNVAYSENYYIEEIVSTMEEFLNKKSLKISQNVGEHYSIDIHELDYNFELNKKEYLNKLLYKYYDRT